MNIYIPIHKINEKNIYINTTSIFKNAGQSKYKIHYFSNNSSFNGIYIIYHYNLCNMNKIINIEDNILSLLKEKISKKPVKNLCHAFDKKNKSKQIFIKIYSIWENEYEYGLNYKFYPSVE